MEISQYKADLDKMTKSYHEEVERTKALKKTVSKQRWEIENLKVENEDSQARELESMKRVHLLEAEKEKMNIDQLKEMEFMKQSHQYQTQQVLKQNNMGVTQEIP